MERNQQIDDIINGIDRFLQTELITREDLTIGICATQLGVEIAADDPKLHKSAQEIREFYSNTSNDGGALTNGQYTDATIRRYTEAAKKTKDLLIEV